MNSSFIVVASAFFALTGNVNVEAAPSPPIQLLGTPVTFESYTMNLPKGYSSVTLPSSASARSGGANRDHEYRHAPLADGATLIIMVSLFTQSPNDPSSAPLDDVLSGEIDQMKKGTTALSTTTTDHLSIGGLPFEHLLAWARLPSTSGSSAFCESSYAGQDGRTIIAISFMDIGAQHPDSFRAANAAIMTLHKTGAIIQP